MTKLGYWHLAEEKETEVAAALVKWTERSLGSKDVAKQEQ